MKENRNILVTLTFAGTNYHGFQIQQNALTVQAVFQDALKGVLGTLPDIKGCSRTDAGVHATEYCVSFHTGAGITVKKLPDALNDSLPKDIRILSAREVPPDFHARYSCIKKRYRYAVWNERIMNPFYLDRALHFPRRIDETAVRAAAERFLGKHDFAPFSGNRRGGDTFRTVFCFDVERCGSLVIFSAEANGFLYHMVRVMVGTLLSVARGRLLAEDISRIFDSGIRPNESFTAAAEGLYLDRVFYGLDGDGSGGKTAGTESDGSVLWRGLHDASR